MSIRILPVLVFLAAAFAPAPAPGADTPVRTLRVLLDPGHGGRAENATATTGDDWDSEYGRFLRIVNFGAAFKLGPGSYVYEYELALAIARRVERWLSLTKTDPGWAQFQAMLLELGARGTPERAIIETKLSRTDDYRAKLAAGLLDCDRDYRFFDSPATLPATNGVALYPGRLSQIIDWAPDLVVCLHLNDQESRNVRGANALFAPAPADYEALRQTALKGQPFTPSLELISKYWMSRGRAKGVRESMLEAAWYHYIGFGPQPSGGLAPDLHHPDGEVWNHITWDYRDSTPKPMLTSLDGPFDGPFWDREKSPAEQLRRGGGFEGVGGDNLFSGQEILRYVRTSLWRDIRGPNPLPPELFGSAVFPDRAIGEQERPLCSNWTLPIYLNSVVAYLELGYLSNQQDRWLLTNRTEQYARGIAAGIYSLATGLKLNPTPGVRLPSGLPIRWGIYKSHVQQAKWTKPAPPVVENLNVLSMPAEFFKRRPGPPPAKRKPAPQSKAKRPSRSRRGGSR